MAKEQIEIKALIRSDLDAGGVVKKVSNIQQALKKIDLPPHLQKKFNGLFADFNDSIDKINDQFSKGFDTKASIKNIKDLGKTFESVVSGIVSSWQEVEDNKELAFKLSPNLKKEFNEVDNSIEQIKQSIKGIKTNTLNELSDVFNSLKGGKAKEIGAEIKKAFEIGDLERVNELLAEAIANRQKYAQTTSQAPQAKTMKEDYTAFQLIKKVINQCERELESFSKELSGLEQSKINKQTQAFEIFKEAIKDGKVDIEALIAAAKGLNTGLNQAGESALQMTSELDSIKDKIKYFFSLSNAIQLVRQALRQTFEAAKELDAAMTETAVVTDFSIGDMWDMLPKYTETAQKLGATTKGVYETLTLFYQQGLDTNEAIALGTETLKMARIAGMDYEEATSKMTAALRGFNMELNELSAQRVNDVYSELAAITAADTDQIATAMTKTASIANSANMEFETTAAFLAQIVETTQESAETAGTAMKTVIARFTELKKDPALIGEVDGEVIDANKIETALNSIGVALRDNVTGQFRDLDDVFLDIAQKWEGLDTNTQRYIATIAAGSRQQSRFIAMMSDYERTMELVTAANNSAGSSQAQFNKTLDSMEAKLNQLKNTWQEFTLGLMDQGVLKGLIEALNVLLSVVNKMTDLPGILGSASKAFLSFFLLFSGKKLFNIASKSLLPNLVSSFTGSGQVAGINFSEAFIKEIQKTKLSFSSFKLNFNNKAANQVAASITSYQTAVKKATIGELRYEAALRNRGLTQAQVEAGEVKDAFILAGDASVKKASIALDKEKAKVLSQLALTYGLNNEQAEEMFEMTLYGISTDSAAIASKNGLTLAILKEAAIKKLGANATEEEIKAEISRMIFEKASLKQKYVLLALKLKDIAVQKTKIISDKLQSKASLAKASAYISEKIAAMGATAATIAFTAVIVAAVAVVALLVAGIVAIVKAYQNWQQQTTYASKRTEKLKDEVKEATEAYEELKNTIEDLENLEDSLAGLQKGTAEWKKAVAEVNAEVLRLVDLYPFLAQYLKMEGGIFSFTEGYDQAVLNHQADQLQAKQLLASSASLTETQIKQSRGEDDWANQTKELLVEFTSELEDNWMLTASVNGTSAMTTAGVLDEYSFSKLAEKYIREGSITEKDYIDAIFGQFGSGLSYTVEFDPDLQNNQDTGFNDFYRLLTEKQPYYSAIAQSNQAEQISVISSVNDMSKFTANEEQLVYKRLTELMDTRTWEEDGQTVTYGDDKKIKAEYIKLLKNADDSYSYNISGSGETKTLSRTKAGKTEYRNQDGEWQEEAVNGLTMDEAYKVIKNSKVAQITEADEEWVKRINNQISTLDETRQEKARYLINSEATSIEDIESWFTEGNRTTKAFEDAIQGLDEDARYLINLANNAQKTKEIFNESSSALLSELAEGKSLSEIDSAKLNEVVGQLGLIKGLYDENKTAAEEWALVSQQGSVAQAGYLLGIQQKLESNAAELSKQSLENYAETKTKLLQEQAQWQSEIDKTAPDFKEERLQGLSKESEVAEQNLKEVNKKLQDLEEIYFEYLDSFEDNPIVLKVETDSIVDYADTITNALSVIDEGFKVNRESFETLMQTFPEVLEGAQVLSDGTVQLKRAEVTEVINAEKEKLKGTTKAQITDLENAILVATGKRDAAQAAYNFLSQESVRNAILEGQSYDKIKEVATGTYTDAALAAAMSYQMSEKASGEAESAQVDDSTVIGQELSDSIKQADAISWQSYNNMINYADHYKLAAKEAAKAVYATSTGKYWTVDDTVGKYRAVQGVQGTYNTEEVTSQTEKTDDGFELNIDPKQAQSIIESFFGQFKDTGKTEDQINQIYNDYLSGFSTTAGVYDAQISNFENQITLLKLNMSDAFASWDNLMAGGTTDRSKNNSGKEDKWEYKRDYDENIKSQIEASEKKQSRLQEELQGLLEDENTTVEDIIAKKLEIIEAANEQLELIKQQQELDLAEVEKLKQQHQEWSHLYSIDENGAMLWDDEAIQAMGFTPEQGKIFEEWQKQMTAAQENALASSLDGIEKINEINGLLQVITNEFDEIYNNDLKIADLQREREKLEIEYNKILKKNNASAKELADNIGKQLENLKQEEKIQKQNLDLSTFQLDAFLLRSDNQQFQKYYKYDRENSSIEFNTEALEALAASGNEEAYTKVADFIKRVVEFLDIIHEDESELLDIKQKELEKAEMSEGAANDLEVQVYEELIKYMENQIEELSDLYDSIETSNSNILDSIQQSLDLQRQERSNAEAEQEIVDMRNRLAYLQMDTSGANANEIMSLQKQLTEKEEDYTDTLIDQKISELQRQNDFATEQRERQITLLEDQLTAAKEDGTLAEAAKQVVVEAINNGNMSKPLGDIAGLLGTGENGAIYNALGANGSIAQGLGNLLGDKDGSGIAALVNRFGSFFPAESSMSEIMKKNLTVDTGRMLTKTELADQEKELLESIAYATAGVKERQQNLTALDSWKINQIVSGKESVDSLSAYEFATYDIDQDGDLDWLDARNVLRMSVGLKPEFVDMAKVENRQRNFGANDLLVMQSLVASKLDPSELSAEDFAVYDITGDGVIDAWDFHAMGRIMNGKHSGVEGKKFATGGLADYTGPAWLDGTKSRPELVLNQQDTKNFLQLKDILSSFMSNNNSLQNSAENHGDNYYEIHLNVEKITSDYDVEQLANKVKLIIAEDANSRGVNSIYRRR